MRESFQSIVKKRNNRENLILFTGGNSFIGSNLAIEFLKKGYTIIFLLRPDEKYSAAQRLNHILKLADYHNTNNIKVIDGQITQPMLGLDEYTYLYLLDNVDEIVHSASNTSFKEAQKKIIENCNIQGTINLLDIAKNGKSWFFHYISTAYSVGKVEGECGENYPQQEKFLNTYERSKHIAEGHVLKTCDKFGIRANIYRPSIVFGNSQTGKCIRFNALYYFIRTIHYLKTVYEKDINENGGRRAKMVGVKRMNDGRLYLPLRIKRKPGCFFNTLPVDFAVNSIMAIYDECIEGDIFNIIDPKHYIVEDFIDFIQCALNISGLTCVSQEDLSKESQNPIEELFYAFMKMYDPYFSDERIFNNAKAAKITDKKGIFAPVLDNEVFGRLVNYAIEMNWGKDLFTHFMTDDQAPEEWSLNLNDYIDRKSSLTA